MGATTFFDKVEAKTPKQGYEILVNDAVMTKGYSPVNGTISTTQGFIEFEFPKEWEGKEYEYAEKLIDTNESISKYGNCGYFILSSTDSFDDLPYSTTAKRIKLDGARKWKTSYTVIRVIHQRNSHIESFDTQGEAETYAKNYALENNCVTAIKIEKNLVNSEEIIVTFTPKTKAVKKKNSIKNFMFFGWASN